MEVLYIAATISTDHIFTRNLWFAINNNFDAYYCSIFQGNSPNNETIVYNKPERSISIYIPKAVFDDKKERIVFLAKQFSILSPKIIHSNKTENFDIEAANLANIPIVKTMHIGGLICPRSEANGFLRWNDTICDKVVGKQCNKCCCYELPLPKIAYAINRIFPNWLINACDKFCKDKHIYYFSQLFRINWVIQQKLNNIEVLKRATIITANNRLSNQLALMGIPTRVIKHGIRSYNRLPYPTISRDCKIKFFYLGRIQYSKGLHVLMQALRDIPTSLYELHIFGDSSTSRNGQRYKNRVIKLSKGKSVYFHGFINNGQISDILKEMHVMIHPAIFHEIYGITISEALSLGKPVLSTRCCGPEMQIIDGYNGWLISPNNVKELRAKIIEIICNKSTLPNLSNQCQCPQSLDANISELRKLYNDLAN